ncbi:MAG: hypothetical protein NUW06_01430 [Candidatus Acetothermia bacterium]|jgi:hypothetical protein|nr:hypothetical protein [Candidatus Acetothermia bacterium]MDH7505348.1 hypothetical protein [Candidatus Acetothermia bacterium]
MPRKMVYILALLGIVALILAGCTQVARLVITPASAILEAGESVTLTATNQAGVPMTVTWSVTSGPGTISTSGVYTAPATVASVTTATVTAVRTGYPNMTGFAVITLKPPVTAGLIDPMGDAVDIMGAGTTVNYDVTSIKTSRSSSALVLTVTFDTTTPPALPAPGSLVGPGDLAGFITLDTDEDGSTGLPSANSFFCPSLPSSASGVDFFIPLFFRNGAGNYDVYETAGFTDVGDATPALAGNVLTISVPLTSLGGDDGMTYLSSVQGDDMGPTDCLPDEGAAVVTGKGVVPEENPYLSFLVDLGVTGPGWVQNPSISVQTSSSSL